MEVTVHPCAPLMCFSYVLDYRETNACTRCPAIRTGAAIESGLKIFSLSSRRDEGALIPDTDERLCLLFLNVDRDGGIRASVFGGVIQYLEKAPSSGAACQPIPCYVGLSTEN